MDPWWTKSWWSQNQSNQGHAFPTEPDRAADLHGNGQLPKQILPHLGSNVRTLAETDEERCALCMVAGASQSVPKSQANNHWSTCLGPLWPRKGELDTIRCQPKGHWMCIDAGRQMSVLCKLITQRSRIAIQQHRERDSYCLLVPRKVQPLCLQQESGYWNRPQTTRKHMEEEHTKCDTTSPEASAENGKIQCRYEVHPRQNQRDCWMDALSRVSSMDPSEEDQGVPLVEVNAITNTLPASPAKLDEIHDYTSAGLLCKISARSLYVTSLGCLSVVPHRLLIIGILRY